MGPWGIQGQVGLKEILIVQFHRKQPDLEEAVQKDFDGLFYSSTGDVIPKGPPAILIGETGVQHFHAEINQGVMYSTLSKKENGSQEFTLFSNVSSVDSGGQLNRSPYSSDSSSDEDSDLDDEWLPQTLKIPGQINCPSHLRPSLEECELGPRQKEGSCLRGLSKVYKGKNQIPKSPTHRGQEEKAIGMLSRQRTTHGVSRIPRASKIPSPRLQKPKRLPTGRKKKTRTLSQLPLAPIP